MKYLYLVSTSTSYRSMRSFRNSASSHLDKFDYLPSKVFFVAVSYYNSMSRKKIHEFGAVESCPVSNSARW